MNPVPVQTPDTATAALPFRLSVLAALALSTGCTTFGEGLLPSSKVDYRSATVRAQPLEVPPDLTQLAREGRYQPQRGVVSAAAVGAAAAAAPAAAATATSTVALQAVGEMRIARDGQQRWLLVPKAPEELWPLLKSFWEERGFTLAQADAKAGVMETNWSENRAKLPADVIRNVVGRLLGTLYDSGERDSYRTRVERGAAGGSEIYISHRGVQEVYTNERNESTIWRARPSDPQLEAEFLSRLMVALGSPEATARTVVAAATPASAPAAGAVAAPTVLQGSLTLAEPFDRAWRRVGVALDRSGFTVEDRDRAAGMYFVRYVDPKSAGQEEPGFWAKLFGNPTNPLAALRYRVVLKTTDGRTDVSVQTSAGVPDSGEHARNIVTRLAQELK